MSIFKLPKAKNKRKTRSYPGGGSAGARQGEGLAGSGSSARRRAGARGEGAALDTGTCGPRRAQAAGAQVILQPSCA